MSKYMVKEYGKGFAPREEEVWEMRSHMCAKPASVPYLHNKQECVVAKHLPHLYS
jgi:hypothetical protein